MFQHPVIVTTQANANNTRILADADLSSAPMWLLWLVLVANVVLLVVTVYCFVDMVRSDRKREAEHKRIFGNLDNSWN